MDQRGQVQQYLASDHNMLRVALDLRDANGNQGLDLNAWTAGGLFQFWPSRFSRSRTT